MTYKNTTKNAKTILFASLIAAMILPFSGMNNTVTEELTEQERVVLQDEIGEKILRLAVDNQQLEMVGKLSTQSIINANNAKIDALLDDMADVVPEILVMQLSDDYIERTNTKMDELVESRLPLLTLNVNESTGIFEIEVDLGRAADGVSYDEQIHAIVGDDIPLEITYGYQTAFLQGACSGQSGDCNPIIGG